jgi:hypothetical protein
MTEINNALLSGRNLLSIDADRMKWRRKGKSGRWLTTALQVLGLVMLIGTSVSQASAACSGSGTSFTCPTGASTSDVQNAINNAIDGATITFAPGSYNWSSYVSFSNSKGASLVCQSAGSCSVSASGTVLGMNGNLSGTNTFLYRISGFTFNGGGGLLIWFYGPGTMTQVRVDNNTFNLSAGSVAVFFGENSTVGNFYGVIDSNKLVSSGSSALLNIIGANNSNPPSSPLGTANNMFVEDNTINISSMSDSGEGCMDSWGGAAIVWRHNQSLNCLVTAHGSTHAGGPQNIELYNNTIAVNGGSSSAGVADGYRLFHHQGSGEFIAFNNRFTAYSGKNSDALAVTHYRSFPNSIDGGSPQCNGSQTIDGNRAPASTYHGYPCWHQPGRDFRGNLQPMYSWNNAWSDTGGKIDLTAEDLGGSPDYFSSQINTNRDYYNGVSASAQTSASSPFTGATGVGFGTLANRPKSCTTNSSESGGGVGYFATDQGSQGVLYQCSSANAWTPWYTPYAYPHPLRNASPAKPAAPTGLSSSAT